MADIIQIDQLKIERIRKGFCRHIHLCYDSENQVIECKDCGLPVQPFEAFTILVRNYNSFVSDLQQKYRDIEGLGKNHLRVVKELERIWRGKMLPCCPHCGEAIAPEDGLGRSCVNNKMEMERRRFRKQEPGK